MKISVVIPSKDSPSLNDTLRSVAVAASRLGTGDVEVLVVDSSEAPITVAPEVTEAGPPVIILRKSLGRLSARLFGFGRATGKWILNLDSDQLLHPELLREIVRSDRPAIVIPEVPPGDPARWSRWERLAYRVHERNDRDFRAHPSLDLPVIPRAYDRELLTRAADAILNRAPEREPENLPTQHEDTVLFSYFLRVNRLPLDDSLGFASMPIYHPVPDLPATMRRSLRYGRALGRESRLRRQGSAGVDSLSWRQVYRVDAARLTQYMSPTSRWNLPRMVYDSVRGCAYVPGIIGGYLGRHRPSLGVATD